MSSGPNTYSILEVPRGDGALRLAPSLSARYSYRSIAAYDMSLIPGFVRRGFEALLSPLVNRLVAWRVSPNAITTVGTLVLIGSAVAFGLGQVRWGGFQVFSKRTVIV